MLDEIIIILCRGTTNILKIKHYISVSGQQDWLTHFNYIPINYIIII